MMVMTLGEQHACEEPKFASEAINTSQLQLPYQESGGQPVNLEAVGIAQANVARL